MTAKNILHMLTPLKHMSPFDVNMAADAGFEVIATYAQVTLDEVTALVQDAIFSRPPDSGARTAMFFAGKDAILALDMLDKAKAAMMPPFALSLFADPSGSFTTAAAMVACVERTLKTKKSKALKGTKVAVFGATGVVGFSAAVIAALEGADVTLVGYDGPQRVEKAAQEIGKRFGARTDFADGSTEDKNAGIVAQSHVALCAGRAGVQILSASQIEAAGTLLVVADVNAVPPSGVEGLGAFDDGVPLQGSEALGIGPLAIGNVKYQTESGLFKQMIAAEKPVAYDFRDAFALARKLVR